MKKISYINFFSGIGSVEYTLNKLNFNRDCKGYSEIDKYSIKTYEKHFKNHKNYGDIKKIKSENIPDVTCFISSPPCQSFSLAGKKKGFLDERGYLIFDYLRILKEKQPPFFIFENVRGLLTNNKGKTFKTIINEFSKAGYYIKYSILNSSHFGGGSNRPRLFIVGQLKKFGSIEFDFPIGNNKNVVLKDVLDTKVDLKHPVTDKQIQKWYKSTRHSSKSLFYNKKSTCLTVGGSNKWIITNRDDNFINDYYHGRLSEEELVGVKGAYLSVNCREKLIGLPVDYNESSLSMSRKRDALGNSISIHVLEALLMKFNTYIHEKLD